MYIPRLLEKYKKEIVPSLMKTLGYKNRLAVPRIEKIVVSMGIGKALENKSRIDAAVRDLSLITGQRPVVTKARKSVSGFKLRKGQEIGCKVTLRGKMMYEFLDRLISLAIPRIRDFRGLSPNSFDKKGNYNFGVSEQLIFPEISIDKVEFVQGMNITIVIDVKKNAPKLSGDLRYPSLELLKSFGLPFRDK